MDAGERGRRQGVAVSRMGALSVSLYSGGFFDDSLNVVVPNDDEHWRTILAYCSSPSYRESVEKLDRSLKVTSATLLQVPFELEYWHKEADRLHPDGLPEPHSALEEPLGRVVPTSSAPRLPSRWPSPAYSAIAGQARADPILANSALDRLANGAHQLVIEGPSYGAKLAPRSPEAAMP